MLDMGFIPDIERICKLVPFTRQTLFFTATMPPEIRRITDQFLHNPVKVEVARPATTVSTITQLLAKTGREPHEKRETLRRLIRSADSFKNAIVFCNRKREVAALHRSLVRHGFSAIALHGDMDQSARTAALDQFRKGEIPLLVASDVAARGLDIPAVSHVFNFDVPHHPDDYVHRIGRTGRAGRSGTAISIVTSLDSKSMAAIEKLIGQQIPRAEGDFEVRADEAGEGERRHEHRKREGGRDGSRGGRKPRRERGERKGSERKDAERHAGNGGRRSSSQPQPQAVASASHVPSIGRPEPRRTAREDVEPGDHSHLPAFLLRPVRARV
jgi:superfamily II DNA/RNA helicase